MAKRPTITDLARISGVSVATVDRVLNSRLPVREETARRVYDAVGHASVVRRSTSDARNGAPFRVQRSAGRAHRCGSPSRHPGRSPAMKIGSHE